MDPGTGAGPASNASGRSLSDSEKRRGALPSLERAAANRASRLLFDWQLAEFAYALVAIDPANDQGVILARQDSRRPRRHRGDEGGLSEGPRPRGPA